MPGRRRIGAVEVRGGEEARAAAALVSKGRSVKRFIVTCRANGDVAFGSGMCMHEWNGVGIGLLAFRHMLSGLNGMAESISFPT